jgi:hypothetical protein
MEEVMFCYAIEHRDQPIAFKVFFDPQSITPFLDMGATGVFGEYGRKFREEFQKRAVIERPDWLDADQIVARDAEEDEQTKFDIHFAGRTDRSIGVEEFTCWIEPKDEVDNPPRVKRSATRP